jgi:uncharacterized protein YcfL
MPDPVKTTALALLLGLLAMAGCQTTVKTPAPAESAAHRGAAVDKRVVIGADLSNAVRVLNVRANKGFDGYLKIQIDVQNLADSPKSFVYKIEWLDQNDMPINLSAPPVRWSLRAKETSSLFAAAPTPLAKSFHIIFATLPD